MKLHNSSEKPHKLCCNCRFRKDKNEGDKHLNVFTKEEWICLVFSIVDYLDGTITRHTCRKARKDASLCGPDGQWFKARP